MTVIYDAGALIALERGERRSWALLKIEASRATPPRTHGGVVAQVWRGGSGQARLSVALRSIEVVALDEALGRSTGSLLAHARTTDPIDAAVIAIARPNDRISTSDPVDIGRLVAASGMTIDVIPP
jgi:hypothetical protein